MVECDLAKVEVAGSNPVSRSNFRSRTRAKVVHGSAQREGGPLVVAIAFDVYLESPPRMLLSPRLDAGGIFLHD